MSEIITLGLGEEHYTVDHRGVSHVVQLTDNGYQITGLADEYGRPQLEFTEPVPAPEAIVKKIEDK